MKKHARKDRVSNDQRMPAQDGTLVAAGSGGLSEGAAFARRYLWRSAEVLMYWMPVWVPLILLAQLSSRGLSPALLEEQRLTAREEALDERLHGDLERARELELKLEALDDEIYHERLLRLHRDEVLEEVERRGLAPRVPVSLEVPRDDS
jgi:hypothetical protein